MPQDGQHPRSQIRADDELGPRRPGAQQRILNQVLRGFRMLRERTGVGAQARQMLFEFKLADRFFSHDSSLRDAAPLKQTAALGVAFHDSS